MKRKVNLYTFNVIVLPKEKRQVVIWLVFNLEAELRSIRN